jgi:hypothetical protein
LSAISNRALTILFSGMIAADPNQGGATWAVLQYLLGLRRLGHNVYFVEPVKPAALRPTGAELSQSENASYFRQVANRFGLQRVSALLEEGTTRTVGVPYAALLDVARRADVIINVSGMLTDEQILLRPPVRVYLDLDPAFVQQWHAVQGIDMRFAGHTHFVTVGRSVGEPGCAVPTCGRTWLKTFPPVVLEHWPAAGPDAPITHDALTTIANWRGYGSIEHDGVLYGQKAHSLRPLIDLPTRTDARFLLALAIHANESRDIEALDANRWGRVDPADVASDPASYQAFVRGSWAEFGLAKSGYVHSRCGWFSDRSACYLASGRPVVAQDTGFSRWLPAGEGLLAFDNADDVLAAVDRLRGDYPRHSRAARALAEDVFDSDKVLRGILRDVGVAS